MTNGTGVAGPGQGNISDIIRLAPDETIAKWIAALKERDIYIPDGLPPDQVREHLARVLPQYWQTLDENSLPAADRHPIHQVIEELHLRDDPYRFHGFLEKYGLKLKGADLMLRESVLDACLAYLDTDRFREFYEKIRCQEDEERRRQNEARRTIYVTGKRLREITDLSLDALLAANNPPEIFVRGGAPCRVVRDEHGNPVIRILEKNGVKYVLERCAEYWKFLASGNSVVISPPDEVVLDLMEIPELPLPPLAGIIECPTILQDNQIVNTPGYHPDLRLYYAPMNGLQVSVPAMPTKTDIEEAIALLQEIFCDFPFDCEASRTNTIGALCTAVLRPAIGDCCPMVLIDKPQAGIGSGLITDVIALVASGHCAGMMTAPQKEEEWRKSILSILYQGKPVIVIDNIEGRLDSPALASVLTARTVTNRILGRTEMVTIENNAFWIGNGNNIQLGVDIFRRCFYVKMVALSARPFQRPQSDFRHPDLRTWVINERGRILSAILTLARAWILAGRPDPRAIPPTGSYERWRFVIGGIIEFCGLKEFLGNMEDMYCEADSETVQWENFLDRWYEIWRDNPVQVSEINQRLEVESDATNYHYSGVRLVDALPDNISDAWGKKGSFVRVMGKALTKRKGCIFPNGCTLKKAGSAQRAILWRVSKRSELGESNELLGEFSNEKNLLPKERCAQTHLTHQTHSSYTSQEDTR